VVPDHFLAIGEWYDDFRQVSDEEVRRLLDRATESSQQPEGPSGGQAESDVTVEAGGVSLPGQLTVPRDAGGVVLFAHGSGSSRRSPRNFAIARHLNGSGVGTLLFDLLTDAESGDREKVFDIGLLATRLRGATDWVRTQLRQLPLGYFGASTGAAAALLAAASSGSDVAAVVSRGGRPDLAGPHLAEVRAPTLLIVGGADTGVLELNRAAQRLLRCENALEVVPGASHLFEEPGTLERVADLARDWFVRHLLGGAPQSRSSALLGHDERHLP
jgi:alpha-beta hydrolase superfamily lysophospholipase